MVDTAKLRDASRVVCLVTDEVVSRALSPMLKDAADEIETLRAERKIHPYDKIVELLEKVRDKTGKYCSFDLGAYTFETTPFSVYVESGWHNGQYHAYFNTSEECIEFMEDFLHHRASRGVLFKKF